MSITKYVTGLALVLALMGYAPSEAHATLIGDTVSLMNCFPTAANCSAQGQAVVTQGIAEYHDAASFYIDIEASSLTITFDSTTAYSNLNESFVGIGLSDITAGFTSVFLDASTTPGVVSSDVFLQNSVVFLNFASLDVHPGNTIVVDLTNANTSVPEPASIWLLAICLIGISAIAIRRQRLDRNAISSVPRPPAPR